MKKGWETTKLGKLCRIRTGKKDVNQGNPSGKFPFFTCAAQHTFSDSYSFDAEALLIAGNGDVGKVSYYRGKFEAYQRTYVLTDFTGISPRYLFQILDGKLKDTVSKQKLGNTMPYIKVGMLTHFETPVPPLPEQERIAELLDEAFAELATAQANAEKNLQNARALFESHLQSVFTDRGQGWVDAKLSDVLAVLRNGMNCKQDKSGVGSKISRIESIWNARFDITRVGYAAIPEAQKDKFLLKKGDVLFSHINSAIHVGKTALFDLEDEVVHGVNLLLMRTKSFILPAYLDLYLRHIFSAGYWLRVCKQSINQASVNQQDINRVPFRYPSLERQREIVEQMDALSSETQSLVRIYEQKQAALAELKKSLLHQAFSGNL